MTMGAPDHSPALTSLCGDKSGHLPATSTEVEISNLSFLCILKSPDLFLHTPAKDDLLVTFFHKSQQSGVDELCGRRCQKVTRCTHQPTHSPSREERLSIELLELQAYREGCHDTFQPTSSRIGSDHDIFSNLLLPPSTPRRTGLTSGAVQEAAVRNRAEEIKVVKDVQKSSHIVMGDFSTLLGQHLQSLQKDGFNLPSHDALAQILPNNRNLSKGAKTELQGAAQQPQGTPAPERPEAPQADKPNINHTYQVHQPHKRAPLHDFEDDPNMAEITDLQTKEVENYRSAMSKMAEDIIALRTQVVALEADNSQLRSDLSLQQDLGRDLLQDTDIDVMTKAEIADRIASLKFKLASETSKAASQRDRIQQLQNDLIKKNDSEKELLKLQRVYQQHQGDVQHQQSHLAKMASLEATVKQQDQVIEKMEKALDSKLREKNKPSGDKRLVGKKQRGETDSRKEEMELALAAENARLRGELDRIHQQPATVIIQQTAQTKEALPDKKRLSLLNKLERAEARVQTLEAQLEENSKLWGKQKQEMLTKLSEHRHGFVRTSTTILHNVPQKSVSLYQQRKQRRRL